MRPGEQDVDLVAAERTDLGLPQLAGFRMERQPVAVAMAVGEDLRLGAGAADERIVGRHGPFVREPQRLADVVAELLRLHPQAVILAADAAQPVAVADRDV